MEREMPEYDDDSQLNEDEDKSQNWRRDLERRARKGDDAVKELQELKRREAMREAGLDPADKITSLFVKTYDGDLSTDAIKDAAAEYGLVKTEQSETPAEEAPNPAQQSMDAIGKAAGSPVTAPVDSRAELERAYKEGGVDGLLDQVEKLGVPVTTRQ
jgi:hypothetical protein